VLSNLRTPCSWCEGCTLPSGAAPAHAGERGRASARAAPTRARMRADPEPDGHQVPVQPARVPVRHVRVRGAGGRLAAGRAGRQVDAHHPHGAPGGGLCHVTRAATHERAGAGSQG